MREGEFVQFASLLYKIHCADVSTEKGKYLTPALSLKVTMSSYCA